MKISKSKQELASVISENGGWRDGSEWSVQNGDHGRISFSKNKPVRQGTKSWMAGGGFQFKIEVCKPLPNWHQTILSRAEYFHLYPAPDADGWIEWNGGECPVSYDSIVDVKFYNGRVGVALSPLPGGGAGKESWRLIDGHSDIIAYRLHKPEQSGATDKLSSEAVSVAKIALMSDSIEELVRKPTIEQLASDYRNLLDFARRKQKEADDAKSDADAKLKALELAGEALCLLVSPITVMNLGDEVECIEVCVDPLKYNGMRGYLAFIDEDSKNTPYLVDIGNSKIWCSKVKFISRS